MLLFKFIRHEIIEYIKQGCKGDKVIWAVVAVLSLLSFLPVYSTSSNLAYLYGNGDTFIFLVKHLVHLGFGFGIIFAVHNMPYHYLKALSTIMLPIVVILLGITMAQRNFIAGANASRWIRIPFIGLTFQTSTLAIVVLMIYVSRYLSRHHKRFTDFTSTFLPLWMPVFVIIGMVLPSNFSTAAILFFLVIIMVFLGGYPLKYIAIIVGSGIFLLSFFILFSKAFPDLLPSRIDTWISRITSFLFTTKDATDSYQIEKAKIAIARGGFFGQGPGKSIQRNFLPQSSSDFIYAIIIEEWGLLGGGLLLGLYITFFYRVVVVSHRCSAIFGKLLAIGVGFPIVLQALINMAVAVELFPVTGQPLPLVSSGGTSIWMTCFSIGVVLSISRKNREEQMLFQEKQREQEYQDITEDLTNELV